MVLISYTSDVKSSLSSGFELVPKVILDNIAKFFLNPTFPPSGVSDGHIIPQDEPCNECGARILALLDSGVFILRK